MNDDLTGLVGALGALGIESFQLSQGQNVSTTLGPGGASIIQSGAASTQTSLFLVLLIVAVVGFVLYEIL